jgi:3-deoxy-D-manno-octulosonic-acid transferase
VGEVSAAVPLISAIQKKYPDFSFLVTTTTSTGASMLASKILSNTQHQYLPLDYAALVSKFFNKNKPRCALIMETEIWPNLYRACKTRGIPLCIINGRLSKKTLNTSAWIKTLYQQTLQYPDKVLARSDKDTKFFVALGASADKTRTIGNIKFSAEINQPTKNRTALHRKYILAASTHADEEYQITKMWKKCELDSSEYLLVVVPRHPQRLDVILRQLDTLQLNIAVRSRNDNVTDETDIYIVDTVGELVNFMADADVIFMGGSLVPVGGHNIIEPAALSKPVIFGQYMLNFEDEADLLLNYNAALQVENTDQLGVILKDILKKPDQFHEMGAKAQQLISQQKDTADRYVSELDDILKK